MNSRDDIFTSKPVKGRIKRESRRLSFTLYQAFYGPLVFIRAVYGQLILLALMFAWGAAIFSSFGHLPVLSSLLASVSTITTIGLYVPNGGNFNYKSC